jgi:hypothetical protein
MYILSVKFKITSMVITILSKCKNATISCRTAAMAEHTSEQQRKNNQSTELHNPKTSFHGLMKIARTKFPSKGCHIHQSWSYQCYRGYS